MNQSFATIIHAAPKLDVQELSMVASMLGSLLDEKWVRECHTNYSLINPVVAANIDFKKPEDGEVVLRLVNLAKERNIDYHPSHDSIQNLQAYCLRKNIAPPINMANAPVYVPQPSPLSFPPAGGPGYGGSGNLPPGGYGGSGNMPVQPLAYQPAQQPIY
jgi:hypothetical protein